MSNQQPGFWWRPPEESATREFHGTFTFPEIQPFASQLTEPATLLHIYLPRIEIDFSVLADRTIYLELFEPGNICHSTLITPEDAEHVIRQAIDHWKTDSLRPLLSELSLNWET